MHHITNLSAFQTLIGHCNMWISNLTGLLKNTASDALNELSQYTYDALQEMQKFTIAEVHSWPFITIALSQWNVERLQSQYMKTDHQSNIARCQISNALFSVHAPQQVLAYQ